MAIDLLDLVSNFRPCDDRESDNAYFRTKVTWVAPEAYLNIVFKPAPAALLSEVALRLAFPPEIADFMRCQNGAMLFSALSRNLKGPKLVWI